MRKIAALVALLFALPLLALELDVDGGFAVTNSAGFPTEWFWHDTWAGYLPVGTAVVEPGGDGGNVLHIYDVQGEDGTVLKAKRQHAYEPGDIVTMTFEAKGTGRLFYSFFLGKPNRGWLGSTVAESSELLSDWRTYSYTITLPAVTNAAGQFFQASVALRHGAEGWFRNLKVTRTIEAGENLSFDDFETPRTRTGNPTVAEEVTAPGLLSMTMVGRYTATAAKTIDTGDLTLPPADARHFRQSAFRLYDFGPNVRRDGDLITRLRSPSGDFVFKVAHRAASDALVCTFDGVGELLVPYRRLPADFVLSVSADGYYDLVVTSLSDSSTFGTSGLADSLRSGSQSLVRSLFLSPVAGSGQAVVTLDNLATSEAQVMALSGVQFPMTLEPEAEFDPVEKGWPLVFSDDFDGASIDMENKWYPSRSNTNQCFLSDGVLHIRTDYRPGTTNLISGSLWSRHQQLYGYFEAKVRFTTYNGWWSAFWLCNDSAGNPFIDGFEIDVFEDYYCRNPDRNVLDHNLHVGGSVLKSWNYNSVLPGPYSDWYTIAAKWTPFEITYYFNGRALRSKASVSHSPYDTVTFDAFRHGTGTTPLRAIVSGQIMSTAYGKHEDDGSEVFPEDYEVDYVRVYADPDSSPGRCPVVTLRSGNSSYSVVNGAMMDLRVDAETAADTASPIRAVHLFDSGYYIGTVSNAPYRFTFPMSEGFFAKTQWTHPGRQGVRPEFAGSMHVFCAFAEDEAGRVGHSQNLQFMVSPTIPSTPYGGTPAAIPGAIVVGRYDEGGEGVAYHDSTLVHAQQSTTSPWRDESAVDGHENVISSITTGEWVNYTVNVETQGWYRLSMTYGSPYHDTVQFTDVLLDGDWIGRVQMRGHESTGFGTDTVDSIDVKLPEGRHVLKLMFCGTYNFGRLTVDWLGANPATYVWTGDGADGNWKNPRNWQGHEWGWDFPYSGDTAYFPTNASITVLPPFGAGELLVTNDVGATVQFYASINGPLSVRKTGGGDLHLRAANDFSGGFSARGIYNCSWRSSDFPPDYRSRTHIYAYDEGSFGSGPVVLDDDGVSHGLKLHLVGITNFVNSLRLSPDGSQAGNLRYHVPPGSVITFREFVSTPERYVDEFDYSTGYGRPSRIVFEKGVSWSSWSFSSSSVEYVFGGPSSFATWMIYTNSRNHLLSAGNDLQIIRLSTGASIFCGTTNTLGRSRSSGNATISFEGDDSWFHLAGHDQTVSNLAAFSQSASALDFGFESPADSPAVLHLAGNSAAQPGFRGRFTGGAGLVWEPSAASRDFVFTNTSFTTTGAFIAKRGRIVFADGCDVQLGSLVAEPGAAVSVLDGALVECDEMYTNGVKVAEGRYGNLAVGRAARFFYIVRPVDAVPAELKAATELRDYISRITGVTPLVTTDEPEVRKRVIRLVHDDGLAEEEWRVKTAADGVLEIRGGGYRGVLFGALHYLEDVCGVHWFAPLADGDFVPPAAEVPLAGLDLSGRPRLAYRHMYYVPGSYGVVFKLRNRIHETSSSWGGFTLFGGSGDCHTLYTNLGNADAIRALFAEHPEYFPMNADGERYCDTSRANGAAQSQLCLTNPDLRALWVSRLRSYIQSAVAAADTAGRSRPKYYEISQNDCYDGFCKCPDCQAIVAREGGNAGLMLDFANHVATELRDEDPAAIFMMMALHSSEKPPKYLCASNNVAVRLCDTTSDLLRPWTDPANASHYSNLTNWADHAGRMAMWDYSITYGSIQNQSLPVPSEFTFGPDIRALYDNRGEGFFFEHECVLESDFRDFKVWLEFKLVEDPLADPDELFRVFTDGYYGAAGAFVRQYRTRLHELALAAGNKVSWYPSVGSHAYVNAEALKEFYALRAAALAAVAADAKLVERVEYAFLSLDRIRLVRSLYYNQAAARMPESGWLPSREDALARYTSVVSARRAALGLKAGCSEEKSAISNFVAYVETSIDLPVPAEFADVEDDVFMIPAIRSSLSYNPLRIVDDPASAAGRVIRVALADVRANQVASAPNDYLPPVYGYPFRASIGAVYAGYGNPSSARERFTSATAPVGYRWYRVAEGVKLSTTSTVSPFPGCSLSLDGVVADNSEQGQEYDIYFSIRAEGTDWWKVGAPPDDMVVWFDQVAVVRRTRNGAPDPYANAREVVWTGNGAPGDWNDGANWQGGAKPAAYEIAVFSADVTITSDFSLPEGRLMIRSPASTTVTLDCVVSGPGGLDKRGDGSLALLRDNTFEGTFVSRGNLDARLDTGFSSRVYVYSGGAMGRRAALFDDDYGNGHGSRLLVMAPVAITVPVQLSGDYSQRGNLYFGGTCGEGDVVFSGDVSSDMRINPVSSSSSRPRRLVFEGACECPNWLHLDYEDEVVFGGRVRGTIHQTIRNGVMRFGYPGHELSSLHIVGRAICEAENVLFSNTQNWSLQFNATNAVLDLNGHDQSILRMTTRISQPAGDFQIFSPDYAPATLSFIGAAVNHPAFHGRFTGGAGLRWAPAEPLAFVFSNTVFSTKGVLAAERGTLGFLDGVDIAAERVEIGSSAAFDIAAGASLCCRFAAVAGSPLTNGVYTAADLPGRLAGAGCLRVDDCRNDWTGGSGAWNDPANWVKHRLPGADDHVSIPAGVTVTLPAGNWSDVLRVKSLVLAGTLAVTGPIDTNAVPSRVNLECDDFVLTPTGFIDAKAKGWKLGPGASRSYSYGAAHGGLGYTTATASSMAKRYDDPFAPELPGSGMIDGSRNPAVGGGAVKISAANVKLDGRIDVSGESNRVSSYASGSGGSVWIAATGNFSGSGAILAEGGSSTRGGGGGVIRLEYSSLGAVDSLRVSAKGGPGADLGDLVFSDTELPRRLLGRGLEGRLFGSAPVVHEGDLLWESGHVRFGSDAASLSVTGSLVLTGATSRLEIGGFDTRTNASVRLDVWGGTNLVSLSVGGDLKLLGGARLDVNAASTNSLMRWGAEVTVGGSLEIGRDCVLTAGCDRKKLGAPHFTVGGGFRVFEGGLVDATGRGGMGGRGGAGWKSYFNLSSGSENGRGPGASNTAGGAPSHGGLGGKAYLSYNDTAKGTPGPLVDDEWSAAFPGAGSGSGGYGEGGDGGGLVYVVAGEDVLIDGEVRADGTRSTYSSLGSATSNTGYCTYFGTGAGGGIHFECAALRGSGFVSARGGTGVSGYADGNHVYGYASSCGGGGRVYVDTAANLFTGVFDVGGGTNTTVQFAASHGGEGTVHVVNDATRADDYDSVYHRLEVDASTAHGTISGASGEYLDPRYGGAPVVLAATPDEHHHFVEWTGDLEGCAAEGDSLSVVMDRPRAISAVFAIDRHTVVIGGEATEVDYGTLVRATAPVSFTNAEGTVRLDYLGSSFTAPEVTNEFEFTVRGDTEIVWDVVATNYYFTLDATDRGSLECAEAGGWLPAGEGFLVTADPDEHHHLVSWTGDTDGCAAFEDSLEVVMDRPRRIGASFALDLHEVVSGGSSVFAPYGSTIRVAAPAPSVDDAGTVQLVYLGSSFTAPEVTNEFEVTVWHDTEIVWDVLATNYYFALEATDHGTLSGTEAEGWLPAGCRLGISAVPADGYHLAAWTGDTDGGDEGYAVFSAVMDRPRRIGASFLETAENRWLAVNGYWTNSVHWSAHRAPARGDVVIVPAGASITLPAADWDTPLRFHSLALDGELCLPASFTNAADRTRLFLECDTFRLGATGRINAKSRGYGKNCGPGASRNRVFGAAHAGLGCAVRVSTEMGFRYDDPFAPVEPGSGGGGSGATPGGGAVRIAAVGDIVLDGTIDASGSDSPSVVYGGGSGGSVWLSAGGSFSGSGAVLANGGVTQYGGGGGMIRLDYASLGAVDGLLVSAQGGGAAELGDVACSSDELPRRLLGRGLTGRLPGVSSLACEGDLVWTNGWVRLGGEGAALSVTGSLVLTGATSRLDVGGFETRTNVSVIARAWGGGVPVSLAVGGDLKLLDGAVLALNSAATNGLERWGAELTVGGSCSIGTNSVLRPGCDVMNLGAVSISVGRDFTVARGGLVDAAKLGGCGGPGGSTQNAYFGNARGGLGRGPGASRFSAIGVAASHGGLGGLAWYASSETSEGESWRAAVVDDEWSAVYPGSGGSSGGYAEGGDGGGLVYIVATGVIRVDGVIDANGGQSTGNSLGSETSNVSYCRYFASGSGGGIHLECRSFRGSGLLTARGGDSLGGYPGSQQTYGYASAAGGGGRIFIDAGFNAFRGVFDVTGGVSAPVAFAPAAGSPGTVRFAPIPRFPAPATLFFAR